jgi:hypothetical protein
VSPIYIWNPRLLSVTLTTCSRTGMLKYIGCGPQGQNGYRLPASQVTASLSRSSRSQDPSVPVASPHHASPSSPIRSGRCACCERKPNWGGTAWQASQRVWLPPVAGPWCNVITGTGYIKSANDESLARNEGGGSNLFMEVVTYKTIQGRQLRMMPPTATFFSRLYLQLRSGPPSSEGGHVCAYDIQAARVPRDKR